MQQPPETNSNSGIQRLAHALLASGEPLSFYDAFMLVRLARRRCDVDDETLHALVAVHDHPTTTHGGKQVLAEFLRAYTQRQNKERDRAQRVLTGRDHGVTVRASVGATLLLSVSDATTTADAWTIVRLDGPAKLTRLSPSRATHLHADFELALIEPGDVTLEFSSPPAERGSRPRQLAVHVVVETHSQR